MGTVFQSIFQKHSKSFATRKRSPVIEIVERRELMTGIGFIAGTAFFNLPGSGNASPSYLPGATIQLFKVGTSTPVLTTVTDAKGAYSFNALDPGTYHVVESPPAGYSPNSNLIQSQFIQATSVTPGTIQVTIPATTPVILNYSGVIPTNNQVIAQATAYFTESTGKSETAILLKATSGLNGGFQSMIATGSFDFNNGLVNDDNLHNSSLSGFVYCDHNINGVKDTADMAITGVTVTLTGTDSTGTSVKLVTTTDRTGAYHFLNLNKGVYTITETQPVGYIQASNTQGTPGTGTVIGDSMVNITLNSGVNGQDNDFGERGKPVGLDNLKLLGIHQQESQIVLKFNGALDASSAQNTANYTLTALGKDQRLGSATNHRVQVSKAVYDAERNTVTLTPIHHINIHYHYLLTTKLAPANDCSPPVNTVNVFGRAAVPVFNIHGVVKPAPAMLPWEVQRDHLVVTNALNAYAKTTGLITKAAR